MANITLLEVAKTLYKCIGGDVINYVNLDTSYSFSSECCGGDVKEAKAKSIIKTLFFDTGFFSTEKYQYNTSPPRHAPLVNNGIRNNPDYMPRYALVDFFGLLSSVERLNHEKDFIDKLILHSVYFCNNATAFQRGDRSLCEELKLLEKDSVDDYNRTLESLVLELQNFESVFDKYSINLDSLSTVTVDTFLTALLAIVLLECDENCEAPEVKAKKQCARIALNDFSKYSNISARTNDELRDYFEELIHYCVTSQQKKSKWWKEYGVYTEDNFFNRVVTARFSDVLNNPVEKPLKKSSYPIRLLITSNSGAGKSTLINSVCLTTCLNQLHFSTASQEIKKANTSLYGNEKGVGYIPLYVQSSVINEANYSSLEEMFACTQNHSEIRKYYDSNKILLLIDSLDEVVETKKDKYIRLINDFIRNHKTTINVIMTSRFMGGIQELEHHAFGFKDICLMPFDDNDIMQLVHKSFDNTMANEFIKCYSENPFLKELITNPYKLLIAVECFRGTRRISFKEVMETFIKNNLEEKARPHLARVYVSINKFLSALRELAFNAVINPGQSCDSGTIKSTFDNNFDVVSVNANQEQDNKIIDVDFIRDFPPEVQEKLIVNYTSLMEKQTLKGLNSNNLTLVKTLSIISGILICQDEGQYVFQDDLVKEYLAAEYLFEVLCNSVFTTENSNRNNIHSALSMIRIMDILSSFVFKNNVPISIEILNTLAMPISFVKDTNDEYGKSKNKESIINNLSDEQIELIKVGIIEFLKYYYCFVSEETNRITGSNKKTFLIQKQLLENTFKVIGSEQFGETDLEIDMYLPC